MRSFLRSILALLLASTGTLPAQSVPTPSPFAGLTYRNIGPAAGGRLTRAVGVPGDPSTYYAATASGGVWKSTDGGHAWRPIFDEQPISSIGSLAVAPSDPNVIYVGSGEANIRGNVAPGNGIYVSRDAGKNWTHAWKQEGQIGTMAVHPSNPDIAFAAVLGHAFGPNPERGVYRTTDGGKTWAQVLKRDVNSGASDVAIDRSNPRVIFAGFWQARRFPWDLQSGGPGSSLWVSRDGGESWTQLTGKGLPEGIWGKVGVAVAPSDGQRVYALIEADSGGLFRSDDGGGSWTRINRDRALRQRAWYYTTLTVDPTNPDRVWFPQVPLLKSIDGGKTITYLKGYHHGDFHDVWIDPQNPKRIIAADDGGPEISLDGGESWRMPRLPISQFYHVSADTRTPYHVAGAMQDLGTAQCPSHSLYSGGIAPSDCHYVGGGEAGHVVSDPSDPNIVYAGEYLGIWTRYDHRTGEVRNVSRWPENPSGWGGEQMRYRFQWTAGAAVSPHDPKVVYHAAQVLFRSTDGGQTWQTLSGDLTRNDRTKQQWTGGPITGDGTGVETYGTIFAVAESPKQAGIIWVGSDDGLVHLSRDNGATWSNVTAAMPGFPEWGTVSLIEPSPHDAGTAYVVVDRHRLDDMKPYLYKTADLGKTWKRLDAGLAQDVYLHAVREDPARRGQLYLGTERGV
ncbi:MAG TPA: glycosyl hydrolase, partial [Gemmatimonadales bacterium]